MATQSAGSHEYYRIAQPEKFVDFQRRCSPARKWLCLLHPYNAVLHGEFSQLGTAES